MIEHAAAVKRAEGVTNAAIRQEHKCKKDAQAMREPAIKGSLHALAAFIALADKYDDAVLARRGAEKSETAIKTFGVDIDQFASADP